MEGWLEGIRRHATVTRGAIGVRGGVAPGPGRYAINGVAR